MAQPGGKGPAAVMAWIRRAALPLSTPVTGHGFEDLAPLRKIVGDARIVALGEATHGTREFFQLKHRMFEFLVTRMGFSIIALEANMPQAYRLNDFVRTGAGDPRKLLKTLGSLLDTEEMLDMILWIREYNASGKGRVEFAGFDMQDPMAASENVRGFVAKSDPEYMPALSKALGLVRAAMGMDPAGRKTVAAEWEQVAAHLEALRPSAGIEWAIQNARIVVQCLEFAAKLPEPAASMAARDASMAANVKWILGRSPDARIVLWAHNFHVMTGPDPMGVETMGMRLQKMYPGKMVTFGFAFHQGSFQAYSAGGRLREFTVGPAPDESLDAALAAAGMPLFALDLRAAPANGPVAEWLAAGHRTRNIMAGYAEDSPDASLYNHVVARRYDCPLFVERTTAARPN
jgi:erythromycin esterase